MFNARRAFIVSVLVLILALCLGWLFFYLINRPYSRDWPMWRYDANRSSNSPQKLPDKLHLQWVREYPKLIPTWENPLNQDLMQFDKVYEPVVENNTLFIGSNASDGMIALDTDTGEEKWSFYVNGPVRLPPILGNERLISTWPARGGPVLKDGIIYFAAGIWPFMGIYIYALNADTGDVVWANDSTGPIYMKQPHDSPSYAGVAPQGAFAISGDKLLIPCGRSVPACFDLKTGELIYYNLSQYSKTGGAFVSALDNFFINYHRDYVTTIYEINEGKPIVSRFGKVPVVTKKTLFSMGNPITAYDLQKFIRYERKLKDKKTNHVSFDKAEKWSANQLWNCNVDASGDLIKAGRRLYAGGNGVISAIDIPKKNREPVILWQVYIEGTVSRLVAADNKLFAVTTEGKIYAFGSKDTQPKAYPNVVKKTVIVDSASKEAESILEETGIKEGYCLAYGLENGDMVEALIQKSDLRIIAVEPDSGKADQLRKRYIESGLYGKRLTVQVGDIFSFQAPPYMASLTIFENLESAGYKPGLSAADNSIFMKRVYHNMRPYGGVAYLPVENTKIANVTRQIQDSELPGTVVRESSQNSNLLLLVREGSLPGSADWTHQYGDVANTVKSDDKLVKLPLGLLWFGGSSNTDVLPRHGHGPPEQVIGGRLFIEGVNSLSARDVYTGRVLWNKSIPELDTFAVYYADIYKDTPLDPNYSQLHIPGANARGTNYVATPDKIYIALKNSCLVLDSETGDTLDEIKLPVDPETNEPAEWGYIGIYKDYLIAGAGFAKYDNLQEVDPGLEIKKKVYYNFDITSSKRLIVMDRHTGDIIWSRDSKLGFRHNSIAVGGDKIFCIDMIPPHISDYLERRGEKYKSSAKPKLIARNIKNGRLLWNTTENVFGTWLSYSKEHDVIVQAGRNSRDMLVGEPNKDMIAYNAKNGKLMWHNEESYGGPIMLHGETVITDRYAYNMITGEKKKRIDPLTGQEKPWEFKRNYGCNYATASEYLLTFRSAAAGFFDLLSDGGTGNFGGFKSGCTSNLIAANGVLNAPDYTRTCVCSYQNQASLAMVYSPDVEIWTDYFSERKSPTIESIKSAAVLCDFNTYLTHANEPFLKLWGYSNGEEVLGKPVLEILRLTDADKFSEIAQAVTNNGEWSGELDAMKKDGSSLYIHISAQVITDEAEEPVYVVASILDINNITMADEEIQHPELPSTITELVSGDRPIKSVGINFGAPGDRKADSGTLWLEYPIVGGPSPIVPISIEPEDSQRFVHHSSRIQEGELKWVVASGVKGVSSINITLAGNGKSSEEQNNADKLLDKFIKERPYTIRLYFSEPDNLEPGQRVFNIYIQGIKALRNFDIVKESGGINRAIVKEFKGIPVKKELDLMLEPSNKNSVPIISGIEILAEGW